MDSEIIDLEEILKEKSVDGYCKASLEFLKKSQVVVNELKGWQLYTDYPGVQKTMKRVNSLVAELILKIFTHNDINLAFQTRSLLNKFEILREGNDSVFEKINANLDEAFGLSTNPGIEIIDTSVRTIRGPINPETGQRMVLHAARNVQKPQLFFRDKIDNSPKEPFIPLLKEKPHSLKPLAVLLCVDDLQREYYCHPYEYELNHWTPNPELAANLTPILPPPITHTPFTLIDDLDGLQSLVDTLRKSSEIAVDLEHHDFRSYQGLTCLIQLSTRDEDFIIDPIALRGQLTILNEVFANPKITKVFHGANHDILWLQRDCGIYVVNMFDTHQAVVLLDYPHKSLSALLMKFCSIQTDKSYQRSDWRIRPLPEDFIEYARLDTHYLLYIFDHLRNELLDEGNKIKNLFYAAYNRSTQLCLQRYEKPITMPDSHLDLYRKSRKTFNSRQLYALKELFHWRDKIAREQDESVEYVLPQHMLLQIAEVLPKEMQGILACCNPIPTFVKIEQLALHQIIQQARIQPLLEIEKNLAHIVNQEGGSVRYELNSELLRSKFDLSQVDENPSDLPTLLSSKETIFGDLFSQSNSKCKIKEKSSLFGPIKNAASACEKLETKSTDIFLSPYQRYLAYLELQPLLDERRKKDLPVDTTERIKNIVGHLSSLTQQTENEERDIPSSVSERINRVFDHLGSVTEEVNTEESVHDGNSVDDLDRLLRLQHKISTELNCENALHSMEENVVELQRGPKAPAKMSIKELRAQMETQKQELKSESGDSFSKGVKRKSFDANQSSNKITEEFKKSKRKRQRYGKFKDPLTTHENNSEQAAVPAEELNLGVKTESGDSLPLGMERQNLGANQPPKMKRQGAKKKRRGKGKRGVQEAPSSSTISPGEVDDSKLVCPHKQDQGDFKPFDYAKADYSIFKKNKSNSTGGFMKKLKEKFKAKKDKQPGMQKSGLKSFTWGNSSKK